MSENPCAYCDRLIDAVVGYRNRAWPKTEKVRERGDWHVNEKCIICKKTVDTIYDDPPEFGAY